MVSCEAISTLQVYLHEERSVGGKIKASMLWAPTWQTNCSTFFKITRPKTLNYNVWYSIVYYISKQTKNLGDDWSPLQTESIFASVSKLPTTLYCTIVILFFIGCYHAMKDYSIYDIALPRLICFLHKKEKEVTVKKYAFLIVLFFSLSSQLDQTPFFPNFPSSKSNSSFEPI